MVEERTNEHDIPFPNHKVYRQGEFIIHEYPDYLIIYKGKDAIKFSQQHRVYIKDLKNDFYLYHSSVEPTQEGEYMVVDFSQPALHTVRGFDLFPVRVPSFLEKLDATHQYIEIANLHHDSIILDLGSYAGLTAILFDMAITAKDTPDTPVRGGVITVEADISNIPHIQYNLEQYKQVSGRSIELLYSAMWSTDGYVEFASEQHLASSVNNIFLKRGKSTRVPSLTLSSLVKRYNLTNIDFIKCDIEGAEIEVMKDSHFFEKYSPRILIEAHYLSSLQKMSTDIVIEQLSSYGYTCSLRKQEGFALPLIECIR